MSSVISPGFKSIHHYYTHSDGFFDIYSVFVDMDTDRSHQWRQLNVGVIGGGLGQYYFIFGAPGFIFRVINSPC